MDPQQGPPQPDLLIGQTIGNYLVTQKLGEGGMGSVYLAEHPSIGKKVALKVLHSEFSTNQEVAAAVLPRGQGGQRHRPPEHRRHRGLRHPPGRAGREQLVYFIMEYLAGMTLSQLIRSRGAAAAGAGADDRAAGRRRAERLAQVRDRPPRPQARQHHLAAARPRARLREAARLRHREADRRERDGLAPDPHRHRDGDAGVHVARAVRGPRQRRSRAPTSTRSAS